MNTFTLRASPCVRQEDPLAAVPMPGGGMNWGIMCLDEGLPSPAAGQFIVLRQSGGLCDPFCQALVCERLTEGETVHWIDAASRLDPSCIITALRRRGMDPQKGLARLLVRRGFTLHQLVRQVEQLSTEVALSGGTLVVVDGLLRMFLDAQVSRREARCLLRLSLRRLRSLADAGHLLLVIDELLPFNHQHGNMSASLDRTSDLRLKVWLAGNSNHSCMRIEAQPGDISLNWPQPLAGQMSLDCLPKDAISSSLQPKGDSIDHIARIANDL